eukprot:scaffold74587_cov21-Tisochrysis_lutea.AAC.6
MLAGEDQSQADQPNSLAEGPPPCKPKSKSKIQQKALHATNPTKAELHCHSMLGRHRSQVLFCEPAA